MDFGWNCSQAELRCGRSGRWGSGSMKDEYILAGNGALHLSVRVRSQRGKASALHMVAPAICRMGR
ncbi:hypothetical protein FHS20_000182 [Phyllobacterium endophyticum]|nr:hypothetical protein [Phyllobacterium endophyticum]